MMISVSFMHSQSLAKLRGYKAGNFSFNIPGGRCEQCEGEGLIKVEMQFMADIHLTCDVCHGKRFKEDLLEVKYRDQSITDILEMTVTQAIEFFQFSKETNLIRKENCRKDQAACKKSGLVTCGLANLPIP